MREMSTFRFIARTSLIAIFMVVGPASVLPSERAGRFPIVMSGDYSAVVVTRFVNKELVQSWLPEGLVLADECPFDQYPVCIMMGTQRSFARTRRVTWYPRWGRSYLETFIAVPFVKLASAPEKAPVFHFVHVYLNSWPATEKGVRRSGWPKECTRLESCGGDYRIFADRYGAVLTAHTDFSTRQPVSPGNASLEMIQQMLRMPMVLKKNGCFTAYRFDMHFECARITSVSTELSIQEGLTPRMEPLETVIPGINDSDYGAFHIECHFTNTKIPY